MFRFIAYIIFAVFFSNYTLAQDCTSVKTWAEYESAKSAAWEKYSNDKSKSFRVYREKLELAIEGVSRNNPEIALQWLLAHFKNNFEEMVQIEKHPSALPIKEAENLYKNRAKPAEEAGWAEYKKTEACAWETYRKNKK